MGFVTPSSYGTANLLIYGCPGNPEIFAGGLLRFARLNGAD